METISFFFGDRKKDIVSKGESDASRKLVKLVILMMRR